MIFLPKQLSHYAPESADSISESGLHEALSASAWWRGKHSRAVVWSQRWERHSWLRALCSVVISGTSTHARFVDSWTDSLADTRASRSATPASDEGQMTSVTSGPRSRGSSTNAGRDTASLKTSPDTCRLACPKSSMFCNGRGTSCLDRSCCKPQTWERPTNESECLSSQWPTATVMDAHGSRNVTSTGTGNPGVTLNDAVWLWPTATANHSDRYEKFAQGGTPIGMAAVQWATPKTPTGGNESRESKAKRGAGGEDLQTQAANWPTPSANDHKGSNKPGQRRRQLDEAAEQLWPTATASDDGTKQTLASHQNSLMRAACSHHGQAIADGQTSSPQTQDSPRRLNPPFVEWLMGLPDGLTEPTACALSATQSYRYKRRLLFELSRLAS